MEDHSKKEMTLRDVLRIVFRHKLIIIITFLTVMTIVYAALQLRTPVYEARATILVSGKMQKDLEVERDLGPGSLVATQMALVMSRPIIERTVKALKLDQMPLDYERRYTTRLKRILIDYNTRDLQLSLDKMGPEEKREFLFNKAAGELAGRVSTILWGETSIFSIVVQDFNPNLAGKIANVLSRSYVIFDLGQQIAELQLTYGEKNETIVKLENYIEKLEDTLDGRILPDIEAIGPASVKIISQAGPGSMLPMRPDQTNALIAAFILSIVIGIVLAFGYDFYDHTIKSHQDIVRFLNIPYLGSIPKRKSRDKILMTHSNPSTRYTLSFHNVSNRLYLSMKDKNFKSILLTDPEGAKETVNTIANLGICLSQSTGYRVLIIDADIRTPSMHGIFNIQDTPGLADVLEERINFESAVQELDANLTVLTAGDTESDPTVLLRSSRMAEVITNAKEQYDLILIKCADIKNFSDAVVLTAFTDCITIIINEGMNKRQVIKNALAPFEQRNVNIIGGVLINHRYVIPEIIYRLI